MKWLECRLQKWPEHSIRARTGMSDYVLQLFVITSKVVLTYYVILARFRKSLICTCSCPVISSIVIRNWWISRSNHVWMTHNDGRMEIERRVESCWTERWRAIWGRRGATSTEKQCYEFRSTALPYTLVPNDPERTPPENELLELTAPRATLALAPLKPLPPPPPPRPPPNLAKTAVTATRIISKM